MVMHAHAIFMRAEPRDCAQADGGAGWADTGRSGIGGAATVWAWQKTSFAAAGLEPVALDLPGYGARGPVTKVVG